MNDIKKYGSIIVWPSIVLVLHNFATVLGLYYKYLWLDSLLHFLGGAGIALGTYYYLKNDQQTKTSNIIFFAILIGVTATAAVIWEFIEYTGDTFMGTNMQPGLFDTLKDLFIGITSAAITALILWLKKKNL